MLRENVNNDVRDDRSIYLTAGLFIIQAPLTE